MIVYGTCDDCKEKGYIKRVYANYERICGECWYKRKTSSNENENLYGATDPVITRANDC